MTEIVTFAILGLGTGAAYALTALGVVVIHKGSGVINFAQGAVAMVAAFGFYELHEMGLPKGMAVILVLLGCALGGAVTYAVVMRPLRTAPVLAKVVATIGLMVTLLGAASLLWAGLLGQAFAPTVLPTEAVTVAGATVGVDRLYLFGIALVLGALLWALFRFTSIGLATRATAESETGAALLGFSPDLIAGANWALGFVLAGIAGILLAPITSLDINGLAFIILPALAAALVGRLEMLGWTVAAGLLIGIGQSELTRYWTLPGINEALPFLIAIVAIIIGGAKLPSRGRLTVGRPPFSPSATIRPIWLVGVPVVVMLGLTLLSGQYQAAIIASILVAVPALSLVVVTGYVGQISLAAMTFAGFGALLTSKLGTDLGVPFPLPLLIAAVVAIPIGVLLGLPAVRVRGMNLAVVTLGAAVTINAMVFQNYDITGGEGGSPVPAPSIFGLSLDASQHPVRFGIVALIVGMCVALAVCNLRRSAWGRQMLAVRGNERAAAAAGISVPVVKLQAFALCSGIAAIGGATVAYQLQAASIARYSPLQSMTLLTVAYIGSIASVSGGILGGLIAAGGIVYVVLTQIPNLSEYYMLITGLTLLIVVVTNPSGQAVEIQRRTAQLMSRLRGTNRPQRRSERISPAAGDADA